MNQRVSSWTLAGAEGQPILGDTHHPSPDAEPCGAIIIAHGFKGYKDYGMFPRLAAACARAGLIAHRINFSHSGMTGNIDTFERPDLFERDTWNKQVFDLTTLVRAAQSGALPPNQFAPREYSAPAGKEVSGTRLPLFILGHSRGGVTAILTIGRHADDPSFPNIAGLISLAAPSTACSLSEADQDQLLLLGHIDSPSSRTGQILRVGKAFLQDQLDDPESHSVLAMAARITCPMLIIHGEADPTVPVTAAKRIAEAAGSRATVRIIPGGDHVFNTPNPFPAHPAREAEASPQLAEVVDAVIEFATVGTSKSGKHER